ncbi:MAG: guanylate kinase [Aeriscardovia sp.]|nr:guanylate kinase [Aeriscardovia sp.]
MIPLVVLSGPTAVGKGTVERALLKMHPEIWVSISATTRAPREGEVDGRDYWFISEDEFKRREESGMFLETALVHGMAHYGTPLEPVLDHIRRGVPTLLEIDLQGARSVSRKAKSLGVDAFSIFLAPPSFDSLVYRLNLRGTESPEQKARRLKTAKEEMAHEDEFDAVVVNDEVDAAASAIWDLMKNLY